MDFVPVWIFAAVGLIFVALAIPLMLRRVGPNPLYGLRVPATFADEWVWYEANARSGRDLLVLGIATMLVPLVLWFLPISESAFAGACVALLLGGTITMAVVGWRRANHLLEERRGGRTPHA